MLFIPNTDYTTKEMLVSYLVTCTMQRTILMRSSDGDEINRIKKKCLNSWGNEGQNNNSEKKPFYYTYIFQIFIIGGYFITELSIDKEVYIDKKNCKLKKKSFR